MSYCGKTINELYKNNKLIIPPNWEEQINNINEILIKEIFIIMIFVLQIYVFIII